MKIAYVANHGNRNSDDSEGHILHSLRKLGHEVTCVAQTSSPSGVDGHDLVLFHHWYNVHWGYLERLKVPKVCWYFDKVWNGREKWVRELAAQGVRIFMTDGTWAKSSGLANVSVLRQGIGDRDPRPGQTDRHRWPQDVVFTGSTYGERESWVRGLKDRYKGRFGAITGVHNRELYDLCATVPIVAAPPHPSDDGYWSNRLYLVLGSGGFLVHPRLADLAIEYQDQVHFVGYSSDAEMFERIDYYLAHPEERRRIAAAGFKRTHELFTFTHRCRELLKATPRPANTGTKGSVVRKIATT